VSLTLVLAALVAFGLGWLGASMFAAARVAKPEAAPSAPTAAPNSTSPLPPTPVVPVGFAQPAVTPNGLQVMSVLTKIKGGVDVTLVAQNRGDHSVSVDTASLGPHDLTFRGAPVPVQMTPVTKKLVPGEALVYSCRVKLPDMNAGEMAFTVAGVPVTGQAAGD
jgi:hypothetical protein